MSSESKYICFGLGGEEFAIPLLCVKEVLALPETTPIPQTPSHFLGIMNLRGNVISIMDLRLKFNIKPTRSDETTVIILDLGDYQLGVVVDRVDSVISLEKEKISDKPHIESSKATEYITGVFRLENRLIVLLDVARALSVEDRRVVASPTVETKSA
jgi:purine-binding chemotaxis protein CheW